MSRKISFIYSSLLFNIPIDLDIHRKKERKEREKEREREIMFKTNLSRSHNVRKHYLSSFRPFHM